MYQPLCQRLQAAEKLTSFSHLSSSFQISDKDHNPDIPVLPHQAETPVLTGLHVSTPLRGKTIRQGFPCDTKLGKVQCWIYALKKHLTTYLITDHLSQVCLYLCISGDR